MIANVITRLPFVLSLLCIASCLSSAGNEFTDSADAGHQFPFRLGPSCFSGARSTYDGWAKLVVDQNADANFATFQSRFPRDQYEKFKSDLECHYITYPVGELTVRGFYARPKMAETGKLPILIVNRGGNGAFGVWNMSRLFHTVLPLASDGFAVIGSQYRGSRRANNSESDGNDEFGGEDINDVLELLDLINLMPDVDSARIGMYGWSRGGIMTYLAATKTDRLRAIAVGGTPTDLFAELSLRPEMERVFRARIPNYDENKETALTARSAAMWAGKLESGLPILILHGQLDKNVSLDSAVNMAAILQDLNHPFKLVVYEDGSHGLMEHRNEVRRELSAWFKEKLTVR